MTLQAIAASILYHYTMEDNNQLNIELDEATAKGSYSNLAVITHSGTEFVLDFLRMLPGMPKAKVDSRIILAPEHAQRLLIALKDNITKYEQANGPIKTSPQNIMPMNFGGPTAQA